MHVQRGLQYGRITALGHVSVRPSVLLLLCLLLCTIVAKSPYQEGSELSWIDFQNTDYPQAAELVHTYSSVFARSKCNVFGLYKRYICGWLELLKTLWNAPLIVIDERNVTSYLSFSYLYPLVLFSAVV